MDMTHKVRHIHLLVAMSKKPRHRRRTSKQERNIKQML